jgi:hypothetical protein
MKAANTIAIVVGLGVLGVGALAQPAHAERWRQAVTDPAYPHITVESELYASETISAPVRSGPRGDEVRLPGGTWVPCGFNCDFTLRNATTYFLSKKGILMLRSASRCARLEAWVSSFKTAASW